MQSALTWSLAKVSNPSADQSDAYAKIEAAMRLAVARYVVRLEPLASTPAGVLATAVGPTVDRYLTGALR